ncbi:cholecystokinin receptor type A-like [Lytechinus variegatus]|uniref:cholecystokinin receptor type A-like n=1 Tax=Lytechinus variegatus TaxID=7654 RepID=UPI001BB2B816|nr:cholecystokinin receptor type A-like [Lytechinus variegatus]
MEPYMGVLVTFYVVLMVVGIPGNILIVLVTANRTTKKSVHVLIIALAIADLLACCLLPFGIHFWLTFNDQQSPVLCKIHIFTNFISVFTSMFISNAVAFDRYFAVCYPLKTFIDLHRSFKICVACFFIAFICSVPSVFVFGIRRHGPSVSHCTVTANQWLIEGIYGIIVFAFLLSAAVLTTLYLQMCVILRRRVRSRARVAPAPRCKPSPDVAPPKNDHCIPTISHKVSAGDSSTYRSSEAVLVSGSSSARPPRDVNLAVPRIHTPSLRSFPEETARPANNNVVAVADAMRNKTTKMLILSTAVFIVSWLPNIIIKAIPSAQYQQLSQVHPALLITIRCFEYLFLINHAVNPFVYSLVNKRFRGLCVDYIKKLRRKFTNNSG